MKLEEIIQKYNDNIEEEQTKVFESYENQKIKNKLEMIKIVEAGYLYETEEPQKEKTSKRLLRFFKQK